MKNQKLLFYLTLLFTSNLFAQIIVSGKILDEAGLPLPGANIIELGTKNGTTTGFDGSFKFTTKSNTGKIDVSFIGYENHLLIFSSEIKNFDNIQMTLSNNLLNEVVLIGYGTTKMKNVTTAIGNVENVETINGRPVSNLSDFLQGSVAGVTVLSQGGDPSRQNVVSIRGIGSINFSNPLTIVDGVPYYGPQINPNDIESVSILKDAAAAAVYGVQAGNGVIVIKTKKGKLGKPILNLNINGGVQQASNLPTPLSAKQQADTYNLAAENAGIPKIEAHNPVKNPWGQITRTNWINAIFRPALFTNVNATFSGASENSNYMMSAGYNEKEGVLIGTKYDRYSFRVKSSYDLFDNFTVGENVYYSRTESIGTKTNDGYAGTIINAIYMPAAAPIYDDKGNFHGVTPYNLKNFAGTYGDVYNPVALLLRPTITNPTNFINANFFVEYEFLKNTTFKSSYTYSYTTEDYKRFQPKIPELGRSNNENSLQTSNTIDKLWTWENQINYKKSFGKHNLNLTAVYTAQKSYYENNSVKGINFDREEKEYQFMGNAGRIDKGDIKVSVSEEALTSATGRLMYNFDNRYFIAGSIRRDGSSKPVGNNQYDFFPAVSVGWDISREIKSKVINNLKIRASWGKIGNLQPVSPYRTALINNTTVNIGEDGLVNDSGSYLEKIVNPDLIWEKIETKNIGLDASLLNNSLSFIFDYYQKNTKDMVLAGLPDLHIGTNADFVNGGEVLNEGLEISLNYKNNFGDLKVSANANTSITLNNELINLKGYNEAGINYIPNNQRVRDELSPYKTYIGSPLYSYYLIPYLGIFQNKSEIDNYVNSKGSKIQPDALPGDFKFKDTNGDGKIDDKDRVSMGNYFPDITYNVGLKLDYKGVDLGLLFQGVAGAKVFNAYKYSTYNAALQGYNLDNRVLNAWTPNHTDTDIPKISLKDDNGNFSKNSSWYLENADYIRLKNISLGYTFSKNYLPFMKNSTLRVYFSADNVFTITNYSGMDPEVGGIGLDVGNYPLPKIFSTGISLKL